ncbi:MAG: relaxase/mobilization nuclease domain-containing protein, partial [Segetibacter sp.]|nr:relaxase/mobilization nuclease domain-containing protein [Segetibacter sp.]
VKANSLHISLNFNESDQLNKEKLCAIAETYMQGIGFEKQPYLVYQHHDAGHPHIHIVTTNIQRDGSKIEMNNIGRNQSEKARKAIELIFGLTQAEGRGQKQENQLKLSVQKVQYGKTQTKQAITNVLDVVVNQYKYTSLPELNAVLKQYNVVADRGKEDTTMYQKRGLVYTALDDNGNKIGTPIKASAFYSKPTLAFLEQKFKQNEVLRQEHKRTLKVKIDWVMFKGQRDVNSFLNQLGKEGIHVAVRQNAQGIVYGLTYIDHINKTVFNGSDIGKEYSAKAIMEKFEGLQQKQLNQQAQKIGLNVTKVEEKSVADEMKKSVDSPWLELLNPVRESNYIPHQLLKKKKQKQSKRLRL